jgi:hypothetical protein
MVTEREQVGERQRLRVLYIGVVTCCSGSFVSINKDASEDKLNQTYATLYKQLPHLRPRSKPFLAPSTQLSSLHHILPFSISMAPKPASTAGKAPASTASKAPAKSTEGTKAAKKTSKPAPAEGEKKKRKKVRKETYSSYIYKGEFM